MNITSSYYLLKTYRKTSLILGILGTSLIITTNIVLYYFYYTFDSILLITYPEYYSYNRFYNIINDFEIIPILMITFLLCIYLSLCIFNFLSPSRQEEKIVKKILSNLETKFTRTGVKEISEKSRIDLDSIIQITRKIIKNQEVHAIYFNDTKSIALIHESHIDGLDDLMTKYRKWEEKKVVKSKINYNLMVE